MSDPFKNSMTKKFPECFDVDAFAVCFGIDSDQMPDDCRELIDQSDFRYRILNGDERDQTLLTVLKRVDQQKVAVAGKKRIGDWVKGWNENLQSFLESGNEEDLTPKYIRPGLPLRFQGKFIQSADANFESNWYRIYRHWLITTLLQGFDTIFEFGCGSGHNLPALARLTDARHIVGLDWAPPSVNIANRLRKSTGLNIQGRLFNFFEPDFDLVVPANSAFLTIGALEQTGNQFGAFLDFILNKKPNLCVNVEPIVELLDKNNLVDYTSFRCEEARNFLRGYVDAIRTLERQGNATILKLVRSHFGSLMFESFCQVIWRPSGP
mgnify:CR=1 FL=1